MTSPLPTFEIPIDPATLIEMASKIGEIYEDRQPGRKTRFRIYLGRKDGKPVYLTGSPNPIDPMKPLRFPTRAAAIPWQKMIRAYRTTGISHEDIISALVPSEIREILVEEIAGRYLEHWRALVESEDKSPNSLRELERLGSAPDGIVLTGGCALNVKTNELVRQTLGLPVFVPSAPHDGGLPIGQVHTAP